MNAKSDTTPTFVTPAHIRAVVKHMVDSTEENLFDEVSALFEKPLLEEILEKVRGNQTRAAAILGLNRGTLRKKLKEHGSMK